MSYIKNMKDNMINGFAVVCREPSDYTAMRIILDELGITYKQTAIYGPSGYVLCHEYKKTNGITGFDSRDIKFS